MEPSKSNSEANEEIRIGVYVCHCGKNIAGSVDCKQVAEYASALPNVVLSKHNLYTCSDPGQETIKKDIKEHNLNRALPDCMNQLSEEPVKRLD